jgi:hypothetical protein
MKVKKKKKQNFCTTKEMITKLNRPPTNGRKIFPAKQTDKGLITRIYMEIKN